MPDPSPLIRLAHLEPLASGKSRLIYPHPDRPGSLIKVIKNNSGRLKTRLKVSRKLREFREYIRILGDPNDLLIHHLPNISGFIATDLGFGLCVEAVQGADGRLAPPLTRLFDESRLTPHHRTLLATFCERLLASPAIVGDLSRRNLVLGRNPGGNDYFALVDGLGDNTLVPMYAMVPGRNRHKKRQAARRLLAKLDAALATTAPSRS